MKYHVSHLPNTAHALKFKVCSDDSKHETEFSVSRSLIRLWGNPLEAELKEVLVAYIKRHGWAKSPVAMALNNSPKSTGKYIAELNKKGK